MLRKDTGESFKHLIELALLLDPNRILVVPKVELVVQDHQADIIVQQIWLHGHGEINVLDREGTYTLVFLDSVRLCLKPLAERESHLGSRDPQLHLEVFLTR